MHWYLQCANNIDRGDGGGGHWLVRMEWHPAGWSVCLPVLIVRCTIKPRSFLLAPAHPGGPGKKGRKWLWFHRSQMWQSIFESGTPSLRYLGNEGSLPQYSQGANPGEGSGGGALRTWSIFVTIHWISKLPVKKLGKWRKLYISKFAVQNNVNCVKRIRLLRRLVLHLQCKKWYTSSIDWSTTLWSGTPVVKWHIGSAATDRFWACK